MNTQLRQGMYLRNRKYVYKGKAKANNRTKYATVLKGPFIARNCKHPFSCESHLDRTISESSAWSPSEDMSRAIRVSTFAKDISILSIRS